MLIEDSLVLFLTNDEYHNLHVKLVIRYFDLNCPEQLLSGPSTW